MAKIVVRCWCQLITVCLYKDPNWLTLFMDIVTERLKPNQRYLGELINSLHVRNKAQVV